MCYGMPGVRSHRDSILIGAKLSLTTGNQTYCTPPAADTAVCDAVTYVRVSEMQFHTFSLCEVPK